jgi:antitoxin component YwqK of YwqJK toxin-antitoxin module
MKFNLAIFSTIFFLILCACSENKGESLSNSNIVEVRYNVLNKEMKAPEYELTFFSMGKVIAKRVYQKGKVLVSEGNIPDGQVVEKYEDGKIKNIFNYKNGKLEGKATGYYKNGKIKIESCYENNNPVGLSKTYYEDGHLKSESEVKDGKLISYKEYYQTGQLKEEVRYRNGEGISKTYDIKGNEIKY